jgi:DNA-binding response OmpR family regulator
MVDTAALQSVSAHPRKLRPRVLCVDDQPHIADSTVLLLRTAGFEALACYDGWTALRLAAQFRPGVCLLDLNMPGMDGDELAKRLLAQPGWRPLLLVAITAMSDERNRRRTAEAGFHHHLVKPVEPEIIVAMVEALLRE